MNKDKIILDLCGGTGAWSKYYVDAGYDVRIITLPKYDITKTRFKGNEIIFRKDLNQNYSMNIKRKDVYGILAAPPCTHFSFARVHPKSTLRDLESAMAVVYGCLNVIWACQYDVETNGQRFTNLKFWALENPNGFLKYFLGKPVFIFHPFGLLWVNQNSYPKYSWKKRPKNIQKRDSLAWHYLYTMVLEKELPRLCFELAAARGMENRYIKSGQM